MTRITVQSMYAKVPEGATAVDTTSKSGTWSGLSPFKLGPCPVYAGKTAQNFENLWQYAKVYKQHADADGYPTQAYWDWAEAGWANPVAVRYPMGRGAKPLYSLWDGLRLTYIDARKTIYAPIYRHLVSQTHSFQLLVALVQAQEHVVLRDYDGYDHDQMGLSLTQVLNNPHKRMGHAFVLKMMLTNDPALTGLHHE